jgi:hypothetical protein
MTRDDDPPFADDGIPVLTDVVDAAELPAAAAPLPGLDYDSDPTPDGPPSLAMFPELEPGAIPVPTEDHRPEAPVGPPPEVHGPQPLYGQDAWPAAQDTALVQKPDWAAAAAYLATAGDATAAPPRHPPPEAPDAPAEESPQTLPESASPPAPAEPAPPGETRGEIETRIFEALAARLDRLIDQRLEPVVEGSIEAAFAGVKAGLAASLNQAVREAVEQAVRDEFEKRPAP